VKETTRERSAELHGQVLRALERQRLQLPVHVRIQLCEPDSQCDLQEQSGFERRKGRSTLVVRDAPMRPVPEQNRELLLQKAAVPTHCLNVIDSSFVFGRHGRLVLVINDPHKHGTEGKPPAKGGKVPPLILLRNRCGSAGDTSEGQRVMA
jgi:hypothetical protein